VEQEAGVVPYYINGRKDNPFFKTFLLADGAYPKYCRFVRRTINPPITQEEKNFSRWQEGARKDIESAFGVLQCRFKAMCTPIQSLHMEGATTNLTACCIVLYNMGMSDRIMDDVYARYDPSKVVNGSSRVCVSGEVPDCCFSSEVDGARTIASSSYGAIQREVDEHRQHLLDSFQRGDYVSMGIL
jgi:hypothetical protein